MQHFLQDLQRFYKMTMLSANRMYAMCSLFMLMPRPFQSIVWHLVAIGLVLCAIFAYLESQSCSIVYVSQHQGVSPFNLSTLQGLLNRPGSSVSHLPFNVSCRDLRWDPDHRPRYGARHSVRSGTRVCCRSCHPTEFPKDYEIGSLVFYSKDALKS